jgi:hypothetical protein
VSRFNLARLHVKISTLNLARRLGVAFVNTYFGTKLAPDVDSGLEFLVTGVHGGRHLDVLVE